MDTKFSTAIHSLILISESKVPMSSEQIAESVGTNSSYIRKVLGLLKREGIISSRQGVPGFSLEISPEKLTLFKIYNSLNNTQFFNIHQNPNDVCIVGKHINQTLNTVFSGLEDAIHRELSNKTLADCINIMKDDLTPDELSDL